MKFGRYRFATAVAVLSVVAVGDIATTWWGLQMGLQEGNPVMREAFETHGVWIMLPATAFVVALAAAFSLLCERLHGDEVEWAWLAPIFAAAAVNAAAALLNLSLIMTA